MPFQREEEKRKWQLYVENAFEGITIKWIYGEQRIGKSTILRAVTWDLQQRWKRDNKQNIQLFYVDLEDERTDVPYVVRQLEAALEENAMKGIKSCVIVGVFL